MIRALELRQYLNMVCDWISAVIKKKAYELSSFNPFYIPGIELI